MTLAELAVTVALLGTLGLVARRFGLSAIPAYLLAGLLLGPNEPTELYLISPSEVTKFVAELGLVFLLFFLGLEFSLERLSRTGRHLVLGGVIDLVVNAALGLLVGVAAFGMTSAALVLGACIFVSSSAIAVKGLTTSGVSGTMRPTSVPAILVLEDIVVAFMPGFAAAGGGGRPTRSSSSRRHSGFISRTRRRRASRSPDPDSRPIVARVLPSCGLRFHIGRRRSRRSWPSEAIGP
jgi:CPA2 family monovalent cation:H+ antiporter-2